MQKVNEAVLAQTDEVREIGILSNSSEAAYFRKRKSSLIKEASSRKPIPSGVIGACGI
jgi:hypothetical protein